MNQVPKKEERELPVRIRAELNVEKWAIWQPANARTELRERVFERTIEAPDGSRVTAKLTVAPNIRGNLTTEDQRVYYALVKIWEEKGRNISYTPFSLRRLAAVLGRPWSKQTIQSLRDSLTRLRLTGFIWEQAFEDGSRKNRLGVLHPFTILDDLKIIDKKHDKHVTTEGGYFRFHDAVLKNLLANYSKPVLFNVVLSFKSEVAQVLYTHLDLVLADKANYERRTRELFEDLGLEGKDYHKPSVRKRRLEPAVKELQGKPLTTGLISRISLEPTKDGEDLKLVVRKGKAKVAPPPPSEPPSNVLAFPAPAEDPEAGAVALVKYFHQVFHGGDERYPSRKAIDQAGGILGRHGEEKSRHIITYSFNESKKTNFRPQSFGAILQYESRALRAYQEEAERSERDRARREQDRQREAAERRERELDEVAQQMWEILDEDERAQLDAQALASATSEDRGQYERARPGPSKRLLMMGIRLGYLRSQAQAIPNGVD